jgi:molybdenum cofactor synthesis domain-containing protein
MPHERAQIAIVTVSDRAARGDYADLGGPAAEAWLRAVITSDFELRRQIVPDGRAGLAETLRSLAHSGADLVLVTGGTGPAPRDRTPEALADIIDFDLPGFGEEMRRASLREVPTAILSRQSAGMACCLPTARAAHSSAIQSATGGKTKTFHRITSNRLAMKMVIRPRDLGFPESETPAPWRRSR